MAQTGNFTPILLYASSTPGNVPLAARLTNSTDGSEIAINIADKNLFFKDSGGTVNTVPIRQSSASSNGWLSSTDWSTFNSKAPATSGASLLYGNGSGGFSNVTIGSGISFSGGTLSATGSGGTVTSVAALTLGTTGTDLSSTVANGTTTPVITLNVPTASASNRGALSSTDWSTFNGKQAALVSGTNIKTVGGVSLLGSGDVGTIGVGYGGTGTSTTFTAGSIVFAGVSGVYSQKNANLFWDNTNNRLGIGNTAPSTKLEVWGANSSSLAQATYPGTIQINEDVSTLQANGGLEFKSSTFGSGYGFKIAALDSAGVHLSFGNRQNSASWSEFMRIWQSGGVSIGNTTDPGATNLSVQGLTLSGATSYVGGGASVAGVASFNSSGAGRINVGKTISGTAVAMQYNYNGTEVGSITYSDTATAYITSSDYRLKTNVEPMLNGLDNVMLLKPVTYVWKSNNTIGQGFIAHELQEIVPDCVVGEKDAVNEDGSIKSQGIDTSFLIATLTAAIQELNNKFDAYVASHP